MVNYREILRLHSLAYTQRQIASSVHSSRNTISEVLRLAESIDLSWPLEDSVTNQEIMALLYPEKLNAVNPRKAPDYSYIHKELAKPGVNLTLVEPWYWRVSEIISFMGICVLLIWNYRKKEERNCDD